MKKIIFIGIFSVLSLTPLRCVLSQTSSGTPDTKRPEKTSAAANSSNEKTAAYTNGTSATVMSSDPAMTTSTATPKTASGNTGVNKSEAADDSPLTEIYRVGLGDVLDIRLLNSLTNRSTLYTIVDGGLIDYPIAGGPISVLGLTTRQIQARLTSELKRLAMEERAQLTVAVREYASHTVVITGLVGNPGTKILRREAVPLYVLLAEVQPRFDASRVLVMRGASSPQVLELNDSSALNFIIRPGDVINLTVRPQEFYYIAGNINYPGQKIFQPGITLVQAILAAGGLARYNVVELSREGADGHLTTVKIKVKDIKAGKSEDPKLQAGDRIAVLY